MAMRRRATRTTRRSAVGVAEVGEYFQVTAVAKVATDLAATSQRPRPLRRLRLVANWSILD